MNLNRPGIMLVGRILSAVLALAQAPILARALGPVGRGEIATGVAALYILPILLAFGVPQVVQRHAAAGSSREAVLRASRLLSLGAAPLLPLAGLLLSATLARDLGPQDKVCLVVGLTLSTCMIAWMNELGYLVGRQRYFQIFVVEVMPAAVQVIGIWALFIADHLSVGGVFLLIGVGHVLTMATARAFTGVGLRGPRTGATEVARNALTYWGASAADALANRLDLLLALTVIGAYESGLYAVAVTIATMPIAIAQAMSARFYRQIAVADQASFVSLIEQQLRYCAALTLLVSAILAAIIPWGVPLLFGQEFTAAVPVALFMLPVGLLLNQLYLATQSLSARDAGLQATAALASGLGVGTLLLFTIGPPSGAIGAVIAAFVGRAVGYLYASGKLRLRLQRTIPLPRDVRHAVHAMLR